MTSNAVDITMPRLSDQMTEGTIVSWIVEDGERVAVGEEIVEIETDKATMAYGTEVEGVLHVVAPVGATLAVGDVMARVGGEGAVVEDVASPAPQALQGNPRHRGLADASQHGRRATPLARRVAAIHAVDLTTVRGTGLGGRIRKEDVTRAAGIEPAPESAPLPTRPVSPPDSRETARGETTRQEPTRLQQVVARRMAEAKATIPHFQVQTDVEVDGALALRARLKETAGDEPVPSLNDFIVRACAVSLREHPLVNGSYRSDGFELHGRINVGIAVGADAGLVVATIPDADIKSLAQVARESRRLAERVRAGTVTPPELAGATFTVSNLGMYGMTAISAVINPPQAAIVGVGAARSTLARGETGEIVDRQLLTLTLSCDHRILNGVDASDFLRAVKRRLEAPLALAVLSGVTHPEIVGSPEPGSDRT